MSEPTLEASTEVTDSLTIETFPDQVLIDRNVENSKSVVNTIKRGIAAVVDKILS